MKKNILGSLVSLLLLVPVSLTPAFASTENSSEANFAQASTTVPSEHDGLLVTSDEPIGSTETAALLEIFQNPNSVQVEVVYPDLNIYSLKTENPEEITLEIFNQVLDLEFVFGLDWNGVTQIPEPDDRAGTLSAPNNLMDPFSNWGLDRLNQDSLPLDGSYGHYLDGSGVDVYIVDSGVRISHNEFLDSEGASRAIQGYTAFSGEYDDCDGHGTHVAGSAAGRNVGPAIEAAVIPVKVFGGSECGGTVSEFLDGLAFIKNRMDTTGNPTVVNMSVGFSIVFPSITSAVNDLIANGAIAIVASGNSTQDACLTSPSNVANAIVVNASEYDPYNNTEFFAPYTNYGPCTDIYAPGTDIQSAHFSGDSSYIKQDGTSMAAPLVAGAAALLLEADPDATPAIVWNRMSSLANDVDFQTDKPDDAKKLLVMNPDNSLFSLPAPQSVDATISGDLIGGIVSWTESTAPTVYDTMAFEAMLVDSNDNWITSCFAPHTETSCDFEVLNGLASNPVVTDGSASVIFSFERFVYAGSNFDVDFTVLDSQLNPIEISNTNPAVAEPRLIVNYNGAGFPVSTPTTTDSSGNATFTGSTGNGDAFNTGQLTVSVVQGQSPNIQTLYSESVFFSILPFVFETSPSDVLTDPSDIQISVGTIFANLDYNYTGAIAFDSSPGAELAGLSNSSTNSIDVDVNTFADGINKIVTLDYGKNPDLSAASQVDVTPGSFTTDSSVTETVTGLDSNTAYYFRVTATAASGSTVSSIQTLSTVGTPVISSTSTASVANTTFVVDTTINQGSLVTTAELEYSTLSDFSESNTVPISFSQSASATSETLSIPVSGLVPGETYFVRVNASNSAGTTSHPSTPLQITTNTSAPTIDSLSFGSPTNTSAPMNYTINPDGVAMTLSYEVSENSNFSQASLGTIAWAAGAVASSESESFTITGLNPQTQYFVRLSATNEFGTSTDMSSLTTVSEAPVVVDRGFSSQTASSIDINFDINPDGLETTVFIEYATESDFSNAVSQTVDRSGGINGTTIISFTETVSSLSVSTSYYFKVYATNSQGQSMVQFGATSTQDSPPPSAGGGGGGGGGATGTAPQVISEPTIIGSSLPGQTIAAALGEWDGEDYEFSYQWYRCEEELTDPTQLQVLIGCDLIQGATDETYVVEQLDSDSYLLSSVTASGGFYSSTAFSDTIEPGETLEGELPTDDEVQPPSDAATSTGFWTKRNGDNVKLYAKNIVGLGKVQFFVNDEEIAWIRAENLGDSKLRVITDGPMTGASYLVRDKDLRIGKNVFEIYLDGERIERRVASR